MTKTGALILGLLLLSGCQTVAPPAPPLATAPPAPMRRAPATGPLRALPTGTLSFTSNSNNSEFIAERKPGTCTTGGTFTELPRLPANATAAPVMVTFRDDTATPGSTYCYRVAAINAAGKSTYSNTVERVVALPLPTLTVVKAGTGTGTVTSAPSGISCGTDCTEPYQLGTAVSLTATPGTPGGWTTCAKEDQTCSFTGTRQVRYGANGVFVTKTFTASVLCANSVFGDPLRGVVKACDVEVQAASDSTFSGWTGACSGLGACSVTMDADKSVTATFTLVPLIPPAVTKLCTVALTIGAPPDATTGWQARFKADTGIVLDTVDATPPSTSTKATIAEGNHTYYVEWLKSGVVMKTTQPSATKECP
jgi:hypothetical protein